jgi:hypothetical protein
MNLQYVFPALALTLIATVPTQAAERMARLEIAADYRYAAHPSDSPAEVQELACREAWRLAVMHSSLYREYTADVVDSPLLLDLAYRLAGHVEDRQIIEQERRGRTVTCRVHGYLAQDTSARLIRIQLAGTPPEGTEQNRALRVLGSKEDGGYVFVAFEALRRLDWLNTAYQGTLLDSADIMVDFYDASGMLLRSERHPARHSGSNDVLAPGMQGIVKIPKPLNAATYRVWLVK